MANTVKILIDEAVLEYSSFIWDRLTGLTAENAVGILSVGGGIVPSSETRAVQEIEKILPRIDRFVPRVRMDGNDSASYGAACRTFNAAWRRKLTNTKSAIRRKTAIVYLADAVNEIILKDFNAEIARLRSTVQVEMTLEKEKKEMTTAQKQKLASVKDAIAKQNELKRSQPRCSNAILTTILHESIDDMRVEDSNRLADLERAKVQQMKILTDAETKLQDKTKVLSADERSSVESSIESAKKQLATIRSERFRILGPYYRCLAPKVVADTLKRCAGTFWDAIDIKTKMVEVTLKMAPKSKKSAPAKADDTIEHTDVVPKSARKTRKSPTQAELAFEMIQFPYSIGSDESDSNLISNLIADNQVFDEYDRYAKDFKGKSFTPEYRAKYEDCKRRFRSAPETSVGSQRPAAPPTSSLPPVTVDAILMYIFSFTHEGKTSTEPAPWIRDRYQDVAQRLANAPNGPVIFSDLKKKISLAIESGTQLRYADIGNEIVKAAQEIS